MRTQKNGDWSIGELVSELTRNLSILIKGEIALVRFEIRNAIARLGLVVALLIVAGLLAVSGYLFFLMMLHSLFVPMLGRWLGELVVMAILIVTAAVVAWVAMKKLDQWKLSGVHQDEAGSETDAGVASGTAPRTEESSDEQR